MYNKNINYYAIVINSESVDRYLKKYVITYFREAGLNIMRNKRQILKDTFFWSTPMTFIFWFCYNLFKNDFRLSFLKDMNIVASIIVLFTLFSLAGFIIAILNKNDKRI